MKKNIITVVIILASLLTPRILQAQGMIYLSNLGQTSTSSYAVGSDSWYASYFRTGNNVNGYLLDSVQLDMASASGNPSGFTVMIYANISATEVIPGISLGTLDGNDNPTTAGIDTYTPSLSLMLSPSTDYFIVLTAGTTVANGDYEWSLADANSYNPNGNWRGSEGGVYDSSDGSSWTPISAAYPEFAITATPIPEPSPSWFLLLGSGAFIYVRRAFKC